MAAKKQTVTPLELATLAAQWLPPFALPAKMNAGLIKAALKPENDRPMLTSDGDYRTPLEVICAAAVHRAQTLLAAAAGEKSPGLLQMEDFSSRTKAGGVELDRLGGDFDRLANGSPTITRAAFVEYCIPVVRTPEMREYYLTRYLDGEKERCHVWAEDYVGNRAFDWQLFPRDYFGNRVQRFRGDYEQNRRKWYADHAASSGKRGAKAKTRRALAKKDARKRK